MPQIFTGTRPKVWGMLVVPICFCVGSTCSWAADWRYEPRVQGSAGYGENINFRREPELQNNTTPVYLLAIENDLIAESPTITTAIGADAGIRRYSDQDDLDSDVYRFDFESVKTTQRNEFGLAVWYSEDSTIFTELEDTGETQENRVRDELGMSPTWTRSLSQRTNLELVYELRDVSFEQGDEITTGLVDYKDQLIHGQLTRILSERTDIFTGARYLRYDTDDDLIQTDTVILSVGVDRKLSETWTGNLEVGWSRVDSEDFRDPELPIDGSDEGLNFRGELAWESPRQSLTFGASRIVDPSASGNVVLDTRVDVTYGNQVTPRVLFRISTLASDRDERLTGVVGGGVDRRYYSAETGLIWEFRPLWDLELSYTYGQQEFEELATDELSDSSDSQQALLTLRHRWNPIRFR